MVWVLLFTLGSWREYNAFIVSTGTWFYRRLISVIVDLLIRLKREKKGAKSDDSSEDRDEDHADQCDCWCF